MSAPYRVALSGDFKKGVDLGLTVDPTSYPGIKFWLGRSDLLSRDQIWCSENLFR